MPIPLIGPTLRRLSSRKQTLTTVSNFWNLFFFFPVLYYPYYYICYICHRRKCKRCTDMQHRRKRKRLTFEMALLPDDVLRHILTYAKVYNIALVYNCGISLVCKRWYQNNPPTAVCVQGSLTHEEFCKFFSFLDIKSSSIEKLYLCVLNYIDSPNESCKDKRACLICNDRYAGVKSQTEHTLFIIKCLSYPIINTRALKELTIRAMVFNHHATELLFNALRSNKTITRIHFHACKLHKSCTDFCPLPDWLFSSTTISSIKMCYMNIACGLIANALSANRGLTRLLLHTYDILKWQRPEFTYICDALSKNTVLRELRMSSNFRRGVYEEIQHLRDWICLKMDTKDWNLMH